MKKLGGYSTVAAIVVSSAIILLAIPGSVFAATTPPLGTDATYGILSNTFTRNVGLTTITGDLGYTTLGGSGTDTVTGVTNTPAPAQAGTDEGSALTALASQSCTFTFTGAVDLASDTTHGPVGVYTPGVYCSTGDMNIGGGATITLNGVGTYIFRSAGALNSTAGSIVALASGASACNVFWTPAAATTLGANSTFAGTDIDDSGITIGSTTSWTGQALAFGGTVTAATDTIAVPTSCTAAPVAFSSGGNVRVVPIIAITKVPSPLALPAGPGSVTYSYTVWDVDPGEALMNVTVTDNQCGPVKFLSGDSNENGVLDPGEKWMYSCTSTLSKTTTNTATATGYSDDPYHQATVATAVATVAVGTPLPPPLINVVKVPSRLTPFPFGGGNVTYTYSVTNPGVVAISKVSLTDDKCAPLSSPSGDANGNGMLDPGETWVYTCTMNVPVSITNTATATGTANGFTAVGYAYSTVLVDGPTLLTAAPNSLPKPPALPSTGLAPEQKSIPWGAGTVVLSAIIALSATLYLARRYRTGSR